MVGIVSAVKGLHNRLMARTARWFRGREVLRALRTLHEQELAAVPVAEWGLKKAEQQKEIRAVKLGQFGIIDRRSWQFPYVPEALHRLNQPLLKSTPYNVRRFSETPIPRRAINMIKNAVLSFDWRITVEEGYDQEDPEILRCKKITENVLKNPNNEDSYHTLMEAVIEDLLIGAYGTMEVRVTPDPDRPVKLWAVDGSTVRIYADWSEATPDRPRYAQLTGLKGERGIVAFLNDELIYIRDNVRSSTPFGWGKMETAFLSVNAFLGAQDMATRAGSDQIHKTWLWWKSSVPEAQLETVRRQVENELEGQSKLNLMVGLPTPEVINVNPVEPQDLLLEWQEFLIRIIAAAFEISPLSLGLERDVNRNTAGTMSAMDFDSGVVPIAKRVEEALTRRLLHRALGYKELRFEYLGLEDPDIQIQTQVVGNLYQRNSITSDEIRSRLHIGPSLPGGWGKLTLFQTQLVLAQITGRAAGAGGGMGGPGDGGGFGGGRGMGNTGGGSSMGMSVESLAESPFTAQDVAQMNPDDVERWQEMGMLPDDLGQLQDQMEQEQPGILETISEQLKQYFEEQQKEEDEDKAKPAKTTSKDLKKQVKRFLDDQKKLQPEEKMARRIEQNRQTIFTRDPQTGRTFSPRNNRRVLSPRSGGWGSRFR